MDVENNLTEKGQRDFQLIQRALNQGDQQAYATLLNNYRDAVYFLMHKMTSNPFDAEDLTIEAFGKAFRNLHQYSPEYGFSTWLFRIATNNCIDFQRKNKIQSVSMNSLGNVATKKELSIQFPASDLDPEETMINKQKIKMMHLVVDKLKPHYRSLIIMRYFDEMSYEEIATQFNLPLGTVKAQLFRAREFLSNVLKKTGENI
ncbi:MAG: RNA polymerase subunit sigma-24 [Bacteroidetes bacterium HGW-Bacteroidetes-1]|jgi:RNA polymerase sigma-70 factor (ECF subfamily)|nr:MAG: RNA polymerase subunit sigma-24 [Bacteroidetes bacterium HGW-Bacteroidetes-1]